MVGGGRQGPGLWPAVGAEGGRQQGLPVAQGERQSWKESVRALREQRLEGDGEDNRNLTHQAESLVQLKSALSLTKVHFKSRQDNSNYHIFT